MPNRTECAVTPELKSSPVCFWPDRMKDELNNQIPTNDVFLTELLTPCWFCQSFFTYSTLHGKVVSCAHSRDTETKS